MNDHQEQPRTTSLDRRIEASKRRALEERQAAHVQPTHGLTSATNPTEQDSAMARKDTPLVAADAAPQAQRTDEDAKPARQPPLGVAPLRLVHAETTVAERYQSLSEAIARHEAAGAPISVLVPWQDECAAIERLIREGMPVDIQIEQARRLIEGQVRNARAFMPQRAREAIDNGNHGVRGAMAFLSQQLRQDPGYATSWHANIAMAFVDAWRAGIKHRYPDDVPHNEFIREVSNAGAARFMQTCFGVDTSEHCPKAADL